MVQSPLNTTLRIEVKCEIGRGYKNSNHSRLLVILGLPGQFRTVFSFEGLLMDNFISPLPYKITLTGSGNKMWATWSPLFDSDTYYNIQGTVLVNEKEVKKIHRKLFIPCSIWFGL